MKVDDKMLHIPPYISTQWSRISALYVQSQILIVTLVDGDTIHVPGLEPEELEKIFALHATHLEQESNFLSSDANSLIELSPPSDFMAGSGHNPFRLAFGSYDNLGAAMQHNSEQSHMPDLPGEVLNKVTAIMKIIAPEDLNTLPKPEPHCNCVHCQFARAIQKALTPTETEIDVEDVPVEELQFQQWDIRPEEDNVYRVINRLDKLEEYRVFLGDPIGCTCGHEGCDHVIAVLKS